MTISAPIRSEDILEVVSRELENPGVLDMHTHLFMPSLGSLGLSGIDEILTYH